MPEFHVVWRIDLDADNPTDAADKAREIQLDQTSTATVFEVTPRDDIESKPDVIDLGAQPKMFSVLLMLPDYVAENYGEDTYYEAVEANTSSEAVLKLQQKLAAAYEVDEFADFDCLLCIEGRHFDINPTL